MIKAGDKVRVKTSDELGGRPGNWNQGGFMDHLFGLEVKVVSVRSNHSIIMEDPDSGNSWSLLSDQYTPVTEKPVKKKRQETPPKKRVIKNGDFWR